MSAPRSRQLRLSSAQVQHRSMADQSIKMLPDPVIERYKRDLDVTLIIENLKLTAEERFVRLMKLQEFAEELERAGKQKESGRD
jgi:hypothetical protein